MSVSSNLDSRTLVTRIADRLREQIIAGELEPGARIRQDEYAEALGVSRTPLREAFRLLDAEGWITTRPRSGVEVSRFSPTEVQDIITMRLLLEPLAIRVSAVTHTADEEAALRILHERWQGDRSRWHGQTEEYNAVNQEFHFALYGLKPDAGPDPVYAGLRGYWERYSRYRRVYWHSADSMRRSGDEHDALLDAWLARDADRAEAILAQHILHAGRSLMRSLSGDETPAFSPQLIELAKRYDWPLN